MSFRLVKETSNGQRYVYRLNFPTREEAEQAGRIIKQWMYVWKHTVQEVEADATHVIKDGCIARIGG